MRRIIRVGLSVVGHTNKLPDENINSSCISRSASTESMCCLTSCNIFVIVRFHFPLVLCPLLPI